MQRNFNYINLNVLKTYRKKFPGIILGLSDHTPGHSTVLGAIALGAKVIEKHISVLFNVKNAQDWKVSFDLKKMQKLILKIREIEIIKGKKNIFLTNIEMI